MESFSSQQRKHKHLLTRDDERSHKKRKHAIKQEEEEDAPDVIVSLDSDKRIDTPATDDILLGRGKPFQNHLGNQRMLRIVAEFKDQYNGDKRENRRAFAEQVLDAICENGTRFLKRVEGESYWEVVDRGVAFDKVSHALRSKGKKQLLEVPEPLPPHISAARRYEYDYLRQPPPPPVPTLPTSLFEYPSLVAHPSSLASLGALGYVPMDSVRYVTAPHHPLLIPNHRAFYEELGVETMLRAQMEQARATDSLLRSRTTTRGLFDEALYRRSLGL